MIGAIIGDIVGSRFEFDNTNTEDFELFGKQCDYTDDTICTVAIADAALNGTPYDISLQKWCRKYNHPKGAYGGSFASWIRSNNPQPYGSYGNGSAMRVSPVAWLYNEAGDVVREAANTASVTHNHPEGIKGAVVVAKSIFMLRNGATKEELLSYASSEYREIPEYKPFSNPFDETCMNAVPVSIGCFLASTGFEDAIRKAIIVGGDSDTIGAIVGSIAEAYYEIPLWISEKALGYLPSDMKDIIKQFDGKRYK